jgi:hypothetical protein
MNYFAIRLRRWIFVSIIVISLIVDNPPTSREKFFTETRNVGYYCYRILHSPLFYDVTK